MKKLAILAPVTVLIFACQNADQLQAGQWEMSFKATDVQVPGAPPEVQAQAKQALAGQTQQTQSRCMSDAEAANPAASLAAGGGAGGGAGGCTFTKQTFAGGAIDIAGTCGQAQMAFTGTYTPTTMDMQFTTTMSMGPQQVRTSGTVTGRRTGDCAS